MRPIKMELCGWGPYREKQEIDFEKLSERGLFLITGDTGAGKTTIFDAITYAVFGEMSGQVREKNSVRSDFADADTPTYVELTMQHAGKEYHISRRPEYMRPKKRKTGNDGYVKEKEYALLTMPDNERIEGSSAVTRKMQEILGMDIRQFRQISMIAQGEFAKLLTASPKEKLQIFRDIFGTAFFEKFASILRGKALELYRILQMYEHKIEEEIDSFDCREDSWRELTDSSECPPEAICAYLAEKEEVWKTEKKKLAKELEQTESKLEQVSIKYKELSMLLKNVQQLWQLEQKKEQTEELYRKKELLEKWLLSAERWMAQKKETHLACRGAAEAETELQQCQNTYKKAEEEAAQSRRRFDEALSDYRKNILGIAAAMVREGEPCPVCGSLEHPHVAKQSDGAVDEKALKMLQKERERAEKQLTDAYGAALSAKKELEHKQGLKEDCEKKQRETEEQCNAVGAECGEKAMKKLQAILHLYKELTVQEEGEMDLERMTAGLTATRMEQGKRRLGELLTEYEKAEGLAEEIKIRIEEGLFRLSLTAVEEAKEKEAELLRERECLEVEKRQISESLKKNYVLSENASRVRRAIADKTAKMQTVRQEYGIIKDLDNLTSGNNVKKLVFEQYVLAGYFEEILHAANLRLERMTSGRFALYRIEEIGDGRSKDNLEIRVLDHYTGRYRSVKTLSGGETFKASLALALGLSDVIQRRSGGIRVECMFIDEGFGALDDESLEQACITLKALVSKECMIGIVSHVPQLREQIENRLFVKRTNRGSSVETG